jgi:hypothetical protein
VHAHDVLRRQAEQLLDHALGLLVPSFAELVLADDAFTVDEVQGGPVPVAERPPDLVAVVDGDRPLDSPPRHLAAHAVEVLLELELRRLDSEDDEPVLPVLLLPGADVRQRPEPVDAGVRAKVDDDASLQVGSRQRARS